MSSTRIAFEGSAGTALVARLDLPAEPLRAYGLFAHCFTCSTDISGAGRIERALNAHGRAVLRFDVTSLRANDGDFAARLHLPLLVLHSPIVTDGHRRPVPRAQDADQQFEGHHDTLPLDSAVNPRAMALAAHRPRV